jgi:glycosyltransferase involved in cell wall biosynthesis
MDRDSRTTEGGPMISVVAPMHNEEDVLDAFFNALLPVLTGQGHSFEIICINDGSRDGTLAGLLKFAEADKRIKVIDLSRNFGKEAALTAGLDAASGQAIIPIDADLQEPPELIPEMLSLWQQGYDVVLAKRRSRSSDTVFKRWSAFLFYRGMRVLGDIDLPENVGDFRVMDRKVVDALRMLPERTRFMKGLFAWLGFRQVTIEFDRPSRQHGEAKQSLKRLVRLASDGLISFSTVPLRMWSYIGFAVALMALIYMGYIVLKTLIFGVDTPGFATIVTVLLFFNGLLMINMGILGSYIARIFTEVKSRPLYLVRSRQNFTEGEESDDAPRNR